MICATGAATRIGGALGEHRRDGRRVHPSGHGYGNSFAINQVLLSLICPRLFGEFSLILKWKFLFLV